MIASERQPLMDIFCEPSFAWELLEWEIAIQMDQDLNGQAIAHLLELYMKGVEKMNSQMDFRQSYFKNKVTSLMTKSTVVKTLNKPPMAKKEKPLETTAKELTKPQAKPNGTTNGKRRDKNAPQETINPLALKQKRKQMEMRLAYEADTTSRDNLSKIYDQHLKKEEKFQSKVKGLITDHQERLKERINRRKLRTATYRSRPEDTNDTFANDKANVMREYEQTFSPRQEKPEKEESSQKRSKSAECKAKHDLNLDDSPKRKRKLTQDMTEEGKQELQKRSKQIQNFKEFRQKIEDYKKNKQLDVIELVIKEEAEEDESIEGAQTSRVLENRQSI